MNALTLLLAQAQTPTVSPWRAYLPLALMVIAFYLVLILPRQRELKRHQQMIDALEKGDTIVTTGGLIGEIQSIRENQVTMRTGTSTVVVERGRVARRVSGRAEGK